MLTHHIGAAFYWAKKLSFHCDEKNRDPNAYQAEGSQGFVGHYILALYLCYTSAN
jgi:hypothetical protein